MLNENDWKNLLSLINRVPDIRGVEVETVALLKAKICEAINGISPPPKLIDAEANKNTAV